MGGNETPQKSRRLAPAEGVIGVIPVGLLLAVGILALLLAIAASTWAVVALIVIAICLSVCIMLWARDQGGLLVAAVAVLIFWMPFQTTFTRLNITPQELGVYGICIVGALFEGPSVRQWLRDLFTSVSGFMRLAILLFVLACLQSFFRIAHPDLLAIVNSFRAIVLYPILFAFLVTYTMRSRNARRTLLQAFVAGATIFAVYAITLRIWRVDVANGAVDGRLGSEASFLAQYHPNILALYLVLGIAFVPGIIADAIRYYRTGAHKALDVVLGAEIIVVVGTTLMLMAIWQTYSRGALAALCLGVLIALIVLATLGKGLPRAFAVGIVGIGMVGIGVLIILGGPAILGRYDTLLNIFQLSADPNVAFRATLFERALRIISEHPLTGIGLQQFATTGTVPFSPHNTYLDLWVGAGLYAVLAFVIVLLFGLVASCVAIYRHSRERNIVETLYILGFIIALVAFATQGFVEAYDATLRIAPIVWMLALCAGGTLWTRKSQQKRAIEPTESQQVESAQEKVLATSAAATSNARGRSSGSSLPWGNSDVDGDGETDSKDNTSPAAIWRLQTTVLPAWQLHSGGVDPWQVETAQLPALGVDVSSMQTRKVRAVRPPRLVPATSTDSPSQAPLPAATNSDTAERESVAGEALLRRAPTSFLWNQMYAMWFFGTSFLLSIVITRGLTPVEYGVYATLTTIISTITFLSAVGLEDTATVFLPRILAKDGTAATGTLIRRLLLMRILIVGVIGLGVAVGLLVATPYLTHLGITPSLFDSSANKSAAFRAIVISLYLVGSSVSTLQSAFFSALLRSRAVLVIGGLSQAASVAGVFVMLRAGWGIDGIFAVQSAVTWLMVLAYLGPLRKLLFARGKIRSVRPGEMRKLMGSAWLTNITNGALGKQMDIMIMTAFAVSTAAIGYYNLSYQLTSIISVVLISGLGGVGLAAMSAALSAGGAERLSSMWRANVMLQVLLATPLQIICFVFADQIVAILYESRYIGAAPLLRVFLVFNILGRLTGGGASQSALYVIGRQRSVVAVRWSGLVINLILDITLIQVFGPLGAVVGTGFSQFWVGVMEYLLLRRHLGTKYPIAFALRVGTVAISAALLFTWWPPTKLIYLAIEFILFGVFVAVGLWIMKSDESNDLTDMMLANPRLKSLVQTLGKLIPRRRSATAAA